MKFKVYGKWRYGRSYEYELGVYECSTAKEARTKAAEEHLELAKIRKAKTGKFNQMVPTRVVLIG